MLEIISSQIDIAFKQEKASQLKNSNENFLVKSGNQWMIKSATDIVKNNYMTYRFEKKSQDFSKINLVSLWEKFKGKLTYLILLSFIINLTYLSIPLYMNAVYSRVLPAFATASLWTLSIIVLLLLGLEFILKKLRLESSIKLSSEVIQFIEPTTLKNAIDTVASEHNQWGKNQQAIIHSLGQLRTLAWRIISSNYIDLPFFFLFLFCIWLVGGYLVLVPLVISTIQVILIFYFLGTRQKKYVSTHIPTDGILSFIANGLKNTFLSIYRQRYEAYDIAESTQTKQNSHLNAILFLLSSAQTIFTVILAFYLLQENVISQGALFAVILLTGKLSQPVMNLLGAIPTFKQVKDLTHAINDFQASQNNKQQPTSITYSPQRPTANGWTLSKVNLSFDERSAVFENVSLDIPLHSRLLIVARPGTGKTSLSKILMGIMYPNSGHVNFQCNQNYGFDDLHINTYYSSYPYVLFHETIFSYFWESKEKCKSALSLDFMQWIIPYLKDGIYTPFNQFSQLLSDEKRQMLDLARMLTSGKKIYVLDDPTTFLPNKAHNTLIEHMHKLLRDKSITLVIFSNRTSLLELVDQVSILTSTGISFSDSKQNFIKNPRTQ
ncbi:MULTISPECIES: ATP-binding cassette domain-containing protein [Cysteiniphilum]|uniref:ATP-binding cassette domain-containing protein n=1 Tax=Cysteiniphilum TaxID=2056696 RepID=UPI001300231A|nr:MULTISPECIES: ATP-binding cassette domain-containing protein [Cysteiniphilum]